MSGHHKFTQLTQGFSPQRQAEIRSRTASLHEEMAARPTVVSQRVE